MERQDTDRKNWMGVLARAPEGRVDDLLTASGLRETAVLLRAPEIGSVMVRGRAGGTGAAFNLGEMSVTRCSLRLACGTIGHGYVQGRSKADAEAAAVVDALMQSERSDAARSMIVEPLSTEESALRRKRAEKAAATKVEFFTMVRGENQ